MSFNDLAYFNSLKSTYYSKTKCKTNRILLKNFSTDIHYLLTHRV